MLLRVHLVILSATLLIGVFAEVVIYENRKKLTAFDNAKVDFGGGLPSKLIGNVTKNVEVCNSSGSVIYLIKRDLRVNVAEKALVAQKAGCKSAIVGLMPGEILYKLSCTPPTSLCRKVYIPLTAVTSHTFTYMQTISDNPLYLVSITPPLSISLLDYFLPVLCVMATVVIVLLVVLVLKTWRSYQHQIKIRIPRRRLNKIPTHQYHEGESRYECCSICLCDFSEGETVRSLPCDHTYHVKCIDPWLLHTRRTCPNCKQKVWAPGETPQPDSSEEEDDEAEPLISQAAPHSYSNTASSSRQTVTTELETSDDELLPDSPRLPSAPPAAHRANNMEVNLAFVDSDRSMVLMDHERPRNPVPPEDGNTPDLIV